jgi:NAD(P)-dependent dehydrogenase (short-subunit alcohol dehydrogenase family)
MSKKLEGKVAVVTGASKGIGAAIAEHLAAAGRGLPGIIRLRLDHGGNPLHLRGPALLGDGHGPCRRPGPASASSFRSKESAALVGHSISDKDRC